MSSVPIIACACAPVSSPSLKSGPTNTHALPVNKYSCWLSVLTHKSPALEFATAGAALAFLSPPLATQFVPSYTLSCSLPAVLSYQSCPSTGFDGELVLAKFSNNFTSIKSPSNFF